MLYKAVNIIKDVCEREGGGGGAWRSTQNPQQFLAG